MKANLQNLVLTVVSGSDGQAAVGMTAIPSVSGTLEIDGSAIDATLKLWTESANFIYGGKYMVLQESGYRGVVFMYFDKTSPTNPDDGVPTTQIPVDFTFTNGYNWHEGDQVRVMFLNESDPEVFTGLKDYFALRLTTFKYTMPSKTEYEAFNAAWNHENPGNPVYTDGSLAACMPRHTKDDGVLSLTMRH